MSDDTTVGNGRIGGSSVFVQPQPDPKATNGDMWLLVVDDMKARREFGVEKYGTPLQAHNGRDALIDAYQEVLDLAVYLRQAIEERKRPAEMTCESCGVFMAAGRPCSRCVGEER